LEFAGIDGIIERGSGMRDYRFLGFALLLLSMGGYVIVYPERVKAVGGIGTHWPIWMHRAFGVALIIFAVLLVGLFLTQAYRP
jgi:hypothetical protein